MPAFVSRLRARPEAIVLSGDGDRISVRVEMPEVWDTVRVDTPSRTPVIDVKRAALAALAPDEKLLEDFVMKLRGFEVLDEIASTVDAGALDGSTFLLTSRRRRPIK